jgi:hypothetical protein
MMEALLGAYLLVSAMVAARLAGHALSSPVDSTRPSDKAGWVMNVILASLMWPMTTTRPVSVWVHPSCYLNTPPSGWAAMRERMGLILQPPPCGRVVRYVQGTARYGRETHGEFLFPASEVAKEIAETSRQNPNVSCAYGDEEAMQLWIGGRDDSRQDPTDVPERWVEIFSYTAWNLLRRGVGTGRCSLCNRITPVMGLALRPTDGGRLGADTVHCPNGHRLLVVGREWMT